MSNKFRVPTDAEGTGKRFHARNDPRFRCLAPEQGFRTDDPEFQARGEGGGPTAESILIDNGNGGGDILLLDDFSRVFEDTSGQTPVESDGDPIGRINGSVNGHHIDTVSGENRFSLLEDGSLWAARINGTDEQLSGPMGFTFGPEMYIACAITRGESTWSYAHSVKDSGNSYLAITVNGDGFAGVEGGNDSEDADLISLNSSGDAIGVGELVLIEGFVSADSGEAVISINGTDYSTTHNWDATATTDEAVYVVPSLSGGLEHDYYGSFVSGFVPNSAQRSAIRSLLESKAGL